MQLIAYSNQLAENIQFDAPENVCFARVREHLEQLTGRDFHTILAPAVSFCAVGKLPRKHAKKVTVIL